MKESIIACEEAVSRFCRLQMNVKRDLPIRASEMGVLIFVSKSQEPATPLMISNFFGIAKPSVTEVVNSLVKKDYLIKMPSQVDRRSYTLKVTVKGQELLDSTYSDYFKALELLEERMGVDEFKLFVQLLQKANDILGEEKK